MNSTGALVFLVVLVHFLVLFTDRLDKIVLDIGFLLGSFNRQRPFCVGLDRTEVPLVKVLNFLMQVKSKGAFRW